MDILFHAFDFDLLSIGFSRQQYSSGLPFPPPGDLPDPETEPTSPTSPALQADSLPLSHRESPFLVFDSLKRKILERPRKETMSHK